MVRYAFTLREEDLGRGIDIFYRLPDIKLPDTPQEVEVMRALQLNKQLEELSEINTVFNHMLLRMRMAMSLRIYLVKWEEDEELSRKEFERYLRALPKEKLKGFLDEAAIFG